MKIPHWWHRALLKSGRMVWLHKPRGARAILAHVAHAAALEPQPVSKSMEGAVEKLGALSECARSILCSQDLVAIRALRGEARYEELLWRVLKYDASIFPDYRVLRQCRISGGACDLALKDGFGRIRHLIELKVDAPLNGIGQLLGYAASYPDAGRTLAVPRHQVSSALIFACESAQIGLLEMCV